MKNMSLALLAALTLAAPAAFSEDSMKGMDHAMGDHSMMNHDAMMAAPSDDLYAPARESMHKGMDVKPSGNADADFVRNMIPHHEGAVAMAKIELEHGKDPALRKLAEDIIKAQDKEIAFMNQWLKDHPVKK